MGNLTVSFDQKDHSYVVNGNRWPSVTRVIKDLDLSGSRWWKPSDATRGTCIHQLCGEISNMRKEQEFEWDGTCAYKGLEGYGAAWEKFLETYGISPIYVEKQVYHPSMRYAGTIDLIGQSAIYGKVIVDIKRTIEPVSVAIQLAGYALCTEVNTRFAVQVNEDGTFYVQDYSNVKHNAEWISCLNVWRILEKLGKVAA